MDRLRVLTLNVWNRSGPWEARRALIRRGMAGLGADLIGLQEVVQDRAGHTLAHEIAEGTEHHVVFGGAQSWGPDVEFGNAILSRWPILETANFPLPVSDLGTGADIEDPRALLFALLDSPWGRVPFFVTHLSWKLHQGYAREAQCLAIAGHVDEVTRTLGKVKEGVLPAIVVGDFNAEPTAAEIRFLTGLQTLGAAGVPPRSTYFADAFGWVGEGPGATFDRDRNPYAVVAREPPRRIDYIFVRGPNDFGRGEPISARVVLDRVEDGVAPSDHFGVLAEITVSR